MIRETPDFGRIRRERVCEQWILGSLKTSDFLLLNTCSAVTAQSKTDLKRKV